MKRSPSVLILGCLLASVAAQDPVPAPKRSLAEGLVRQLIEVQELRPPYLESGLEMGAGQGPLVLMIRRANGSLELHEIERGRGDHGPAAEKRGVAEPIAEELVEEVELPAEVEPAEQGEAPIEPAGKPAAKATGRATGKAKAAVPALLALQLLWREGEITLRTPDDSVRISGPAIDRTQVKHVLERLFAVTRDTEFEGQLLLEIAAAVPMQDVLTVQEAARSAGFSLVMYGSREATRPVSAAEGEVIAGIPAKYGWLVGRLAPGSPQKVCEGELLVLLDGPVTWGDIAPLYTHCARVGIWQIGFVGQKDRRTRFKLPANLPFDRGR